MLLQDCHADGRRRASLVPLPKRVRGKEPKGNPERAAYSVAVPGYCARIPQGQGGHGIPSNDPILLCIRPTTGTLEQALGFRLVCQLERLALLQVGLHRLENPLALVQPVMTLVEMLAKPPKAVVSAGLAS